MRFFQEFARRECIRYVPAAVAACETFMHSMLKNATVIMKTGTKIDNVCTELKIC